ncbi:MAG: B12-binding domain-containing radical SAM protein [Thermoplasmata archaeon]|nr:MAG: B12-binding domain-containing radical SAM protein [Thermoplasmata archaeon]
MGRSLKILLCSPLTLDKYYAGYSSKLKALLHKIFVKTSYHKSLSLEMLSAVTPPQHEVTILNTTYKNIDFSGDYDLVGIHCFTCTAPLAYKVADEFRKRGITVVLGGYHPSALPEEAKQHADAVVIGEAEEIWPRLLKDFEKGRLKPFYRQKKPVDPAHIPSQKFSSSKDFHPAVQATRGCPYQCEFCSQTIINSKKIFRARPIENVVEEIRSIPGNFFIFHDASLTIDPNYTKRLFKELIGVNKYFFCNGNVDVLSKDEELLHLAKEAGCVGWLVGFESLSQASLESVGKKTNKIDNYIKAVEKIHDHRMMVCGTFVFGFDGDTIEVFDRTREFVEISGIDVPDALILTPFPGTPLFKRLEREGRILTRDWSKYDHKHVVFKPKHMTPEELLSNTRELYEEFFSMWNMSKRIIKSIKLGYRPFISVLFSSLTMAATEMGVDITL